MYLPHDSDLHRNFMGSFFDTMLHPSTKFHENQEKSFSVITLINKQAEKHTMAVTLVVYIS